jgi:hypothetical protein
MKRIHQDDELREGFMLDLDEIAREGARRMLARALEAEVQAYFDSASGERDERGHALVAKNGHAREREIVLEAGLAAGIYPRNLVTHRSSPKGHGKMSIQDLVSGWPRDERGAPGSNQPLPAPGSGGSPAW